MQHQHNNVFYQEKTSLVKSMEAKVYNPGSAFPTRLNMHPAKTQISLRIHTVWSESSQSTIWVAMDTKSIHSDSEDWLVCADTQVDASRKHACIILTPLNLIFIL